MTRSALLALGLLGLVSSAALAQTPQRIRGTVVSLDGAVLHVKPNGEGAEAAITLGPQLKVSEVLPSSLKEVKPGSFIGTAAETQPDGTLVAKEVHVFPEAMRGTGEGHYAFDLGPKSTMTNGTIGQEVTGAAGDTLTFKYKGGEKAIKVPADVPVVTFGPGDKAELTPGAHVIVFAQAGTDGALSASRVVVGKDGLVPPM